MRRILEYQKILRATKTTTLSEMKTTYRNVMKECHPDKIQDNEMAKLEAEEKSKMVIEAYHFLVSISPETAQNNLEEYTEVISNNIVTNYEYKNQVLRLDFSNGVSYEYFGVPKDIYLKLCQSDSQARFARRKICSAFIYRVVAQKPN